MAQNVTTNFNQRILFTEQRNLRTVIFLNLLFPSSCFQVQASTAVTASGIFRTLLDINNINGNDCDIGRNGVTLATVGATGSFLKASGLRAFLS